MSFTLTQRSVVGPGTLTPQRRMIWEGSPQAAVAWLLVLRSAASPILSGSATIMGAQAGWAASLAAVTSTVGAQADIARTDAAARLKATAVRGRVFRCITQAYPAHAAAWRAV